MIGQRNLKKRCSQKISLSYLNKLCALNGLNNINTNQNKAPILSLKGIKTLNSNKNSLLSKLNTNVNPKKNDNRRYRASVTQCSVDFDDILSTNIPTTEHTSMIDSSFNYPNSLFSSRNYLQKKNILDFSIDDFQSMDNCSNNNKTFCNPDYEFMYDLPLFYSNKKNSYLKNIKEIQAKWKGYYLRKVFNKIKKFNKLVNEIMNKERKNVFILLSKNKNNLNKDNNVKTEIIKNNDNIIVKNDIDKNNKIYTPTKEINNIQKNNNDKEEKEDKEKVNTSNTNSTAFSINNSDSKINESNSPVPKFDIKSYLKLPLSIPKFIKKISYFNYFKFFISQLAEIKKLKISQKQKEILIKLIDSKTKKIIKKYLYSYKEKILIEKTAENVYKSVMQSMSCKKIRITKMPNKKSSFNFQSVFKEKTLGDLIKKYDDNKNLLKKYYILWKNLPSNNISNISNNLNINEQLNKFEKIEKHQMKKTKRHIKVKIPKKGASRNNNNNNLASTLSSISLNESNKNCSGYISKDFLTEPVKKMKVRKIAVNNKYYNYVMNNENFFTDDPKNYKK